MKNDHGIFIITLFPNTDVTKKILPSFRIPYTFKIQLKNFAQCNKRGDKVFMLVPDHFQGWASSWVFFHLSQPNIFNAVKSK